MRSRLLLSAAALLWMGTVSGAPTAGATPFTLVEPSVALLPVSGADHGDSDRGGDGDSDSGRRHDDGSLLEAFVLQEFTVPNGGLVCLVGECAPASQDTLVFRLGVDDGALASLAVVLEGHAALGAGFVPDGGVPAADAWITRGKAIFELASALGAGEQSNALFVSFEAGTIASNGLLEFLTAAAFAADGDSDGGRGHGRGHGHGADHGDSDSAGGRLPGGLLGGADGDSDSARRRLFAAAVPTAGGLQVIPEPGTLALLGAGLGGLAGMVRRSGRRG